jgi:hypothetical protein
MSDHFAWGLLTANPEEPFEAPVSEAIDFILKDRSAAPQWADYHVISLAQYRRQHIRITGTVITASA